MERQGTRSESNRASMMARVSLRSSQPYHNDAVTGKQKKFGLADNSNTIVSDAVEEEDPAAVGILRADLPTLEERSIGCADIEVGAGSSGDSERGVSFAEEVGGQLAADGVKESGAGEPPSDRGEKRRKEQ
jgi:hypothetical protein